MIKIESNAFDLNDAQRNNTVHTKAASESSSVSKTITFFKLDDLVNQQVLPNYV